MSTEGGEAGRDVVTATVAAALQQQARQSVHPADREELRRAAARIATALQAAFVVVSRHSTVAGLTDRKQLSEQVHE
jgi:hypothetical protein